MASFSLTKLDWRIQLAIFVVLSAAAAGGFYQYYEVPARQAMVSRQAELRKIRDRINIALTTARQLPEFRRQVDELNARLEALKPILPEEKDVGDLLRRINTLATQSNLAIRGFKPQAAVQREMHAELANSLELEGTYHNLGAFLDSVSKFPRIINIGRLVISAKPTPEPNATINIACTATTFVLVEAPAAPAGKKGAPVKPAPKKTE